MKMVRNETKREVITGTVTLELTPQELATITASVGLPNQRELEAARCVNAVHLTTSSGSYRLYTELLSTYEKVFGGKR